MYVRNNCTYKWIDMYACVLIRNLLNFFHCTWLSSRLWVSRCFYPKWEKGVRPPWLYCCSLSGFAALLLYVNRCELLNGWQGKRQWVRHSAVCFVSTLGGNVAGRQRARVLSVLRWSAGAETWRKEFLQDQLDPAELVQRSVSCSRPALCPIPWCKLYIRRESEHVKRLQDSSSLLLPSAERMSLSRTWCVQYEPLFSSVLCTQ